MIEKGKISPIQMAILIYPTIVATAILLVPGITGRMANQDLWMSPIWASAVGFLMVYIMLQLHKRFPEQTIIQYSEAIAGKFVGRVIGFFLIIFFAHTCGVIVMEYGEFIKGSFLPTTPMIVITGSMVLVCALAVRAGLEVIARSAQIFVPIVILLFIAILVLLIPDMQPSNMLPVFEKGVLPSLKGAIVPASWYLEIFIIAFLLPFLRHTKKAALWSTVSVVAVMVSLVVTNLATLFVFGPLTPSFTYPVMEAARYINIAEFIQHLESVVMAIWVGSIFVKVAVVFYITVLSTAQWLKLSDYRPIVYPFALIVTAVGYWSEDNLQELERFLIEAYPYYAFIFLAVIPVLLLITAIVRQKNPGRKGES